MKRKELLLMLDEGLTTEEVPTMVNLMEVEELINNIDITKEVKTKLKESINVLKKQTINHSKLYSDMIKSVLKSDKNEY